MVGIRKEVSSYLGGLRAVGCACAAALHCSQCLMEQQLRARHCSPMLLPRHLNWHSPQINSVPTLDKLPSQTPDPPLIFNFSPVTPSSIQLLPQEASSVS
jgi:hypothetical protein